MPAVQIFHAVPLISGSPGWVNELLAPANGLEIVIAESE
jgi:hypothetical protein